MTAPAIERGGIIRVHHESEYLFCRECGSATLCEERISGYHETYGFPLYEYRRTCPKSRWWNLHTDQWTHRLGEPRRPA